jgi:type III secretory pathway component EscS
MSAPIFLVYYLIPDEVQGVDKRVGLIVLLAIVLAFEALRLWRHWTFLGMRDYESGRMSAFAWASIGLTFTFLFFPLELAAPAVTGMALTDPLIGELRRRKSQLYPLLPAAFYLALVLAIFIALMGWSWPILLASLVGTVLAIGVEKVRTKYVDDDFLMMVVPLLGMAAVLYLTSSFPS